MSYAQMSLFCRSLVIVSALIGVGFIASVNADNRFQQHRIKVQQGDVQTASVRGRVVDSVGDDRLITDINNASLQAEGFEDMDHVNLQVGKEKMFARLMSQQTFAATMADDAMRNNIDVDVVCLLTSTGMEIVGLGGGLVEWLEPRGKMPVVVEKEYY